MHRVAHKLNSKKWRSEDIQVEENTDFIWTGLSTRVLKGLKRAGFRTPSPIQLKSIQIGRGGIDLIIQSKSGTGKTCVFCTIALEKLLPVNEVQVLVVAPTREIAVQIEHVFNSIGCTTDELGCKSFIGGRSVTEDVEKLQDCKIAIGTPGRLKHLIEQSYLKLDAVTLFVLDEADKLTEQFFLLEINFICQLVRQNKQLQIITSSATYPNQVLAIMKKFMHKNAVHVSTCENDFALKGIRQFCEVLPSQLEVTENFCRKMQALVTLLRGLRHTQCIIFVNCLDDVMTLEHHLKERNIISACFSSMDCQQKRLETMEQLRKYQIKILITTDLAARGIDIEKADLVINVGIPKDFETYLHRIGRVGRFGTIGISISLVSDRKEEMKIRSFMSQGNMKMYPLPDPLPYDLFAYELNEDDIVCFRNLIKENNPDSAQPETLRNEVPAKELKSSCTEQHPATIEKPIEKYGPLTSNTVDCEISSDEFTNSKTSKSSQNASNKKNSAEVKEPKSKKKPEGKINMSFSSNQELEQQCANIVSDSCFGNEAIEDFCIDKIDLNNFINSANNVAMSVEGSSNCPELDITLISNFLENSKILICNQEVEGNSIEHNEAPVKAIKTMGPELETFREFLKCNLVVSEPAEKVENLDNTSPSEITSIPSLKIEKKRSNSEQNSFDETGHNGRQQIVIGAGNERQNFAKSNALKCNNDTTTEAKGIGLSDEDKTSTELKAEFITSDEIATPVVVYSRDLDADFSSSGLSDSDEETDSASESESNTSADTERENKMSSESEETSCSSLERKGESDESSVSEDEDMSFITEDKGMSCKNGTKSIFNMNNIKEKQKVKTGKMPKDGKRPLEKKHSEKCPYKMSEYKHSLKKGCCENRPSYHDNYNSNAMQSPILHMSSHANKHFGTRIQHQQKIKTGNSEKQKRKCNFPNSQMPKSKSQDEGRSETRFGKCCCQHVHRCCHSNHPKTLCEKNCGYPLAHENAHNQAEMHSACSASDICDKMHQICWLPIFVQVRSGINSCTSCSAEHCPSFFHWEGQRLQTCCHERVINIDHCTCLRRPQRASRNHSPRSNHTYNVSRSERKCQNFLRESKVRETHHEHELHSHPMNSDEREHELRYEGEHDSNYDPFLHEQLLAYLGIQ